MDGKEKCVRGCGVIVFSRDSLVEGETHFAAVSGVHVLSSNNEVWPALDS